MKRPTRFTRSRLSRAITLACISGLSAQAFAGDGSCIDGASTITGYVNEACELESGDRVSVTSTGTIQTQGASDSGIFAYDSVLFDDAVFGPISNAGRIISNDHAVYVYGSVAGNVTNTGYIETNSYMGFYLYSGSVNGVSNSGTMSASQAGIYLEDMELATSIVNTGTISGENGIYIDDSSVGESIINRGTIETSEHGIYVVDDSTVAGNIINSGHITADDYGIAVEGDSVVEGNITNSGTMLTDGSTAIYVGDGSSVTGSITNSGDIYNDGYYGIGVMDSSSVGGNLVNTGTMNLDYSGFYVYDSSVEGSLINRGQIITDDWGIYTYDATIGGDVINTGDLAGGCCDGGIYLYETDVVGDVTNTGTINNYDAAIYLYDGTLGGSLVNRGYIGSDEGHGLAVEDMQVGGSIVNRGIMDVYDSGLFVDQSTVAGDVLNFGSITTDSDKGIYVYDSQVMGDVGNRGTINTSDSGSDHGIYIASGSEIAGNVFNTGEIQANDAGIYVLGSTVLGDVTNSGTLRSNDLGIYIHNGSTVMGDVSNSGTISALDEGIYISSNSTVMGSVINTGTISSGADGDDAMRIRDNSGVMGDFINNGLLIPVDGRGMYLYDESAVGGDMINTGTILSTDYEGMQVNNGFVYGSVINTGFISTEDDAMMIRGEVAGDVINRGDLYSEDDRGLYVYATDLGVGGDVINTGNISADDIAFYVYADDGVGGSVTNSGTLGSRDGSGLYVYNGDVDGDVSNSGTILAGDYGLAMYDVDLGGDFTNTGDIISEDAGFYAYSSTIVGDMVNSGTVQTEGQGIYVYGGTIEGSVINRGDLIVTDSDGGSAINVIDSASIEGDLINYGTAISNGNAGLYLYGDVDGNVSNMGTVSGDEAGFYIYGTGSVDGNITNTGTITGFDGAGLYIYDSVTIGGDIVNDGRIAALDESAPGLYVGDGTISGEITNNGTIEGAYIYVDNSAAVTNSGQIWNRIGDSYVDGNFTQGADALFGIQVENLGTYGTFDVNGDATFADGTSLAVGLQPGHDVMDASVLDNVISVDGTLAATSFNVIDNSIAYSFTADIDTGSGLVDLVAAETGIDSLYEAMLISGYDRGEGTAQLYDALMDADPFGELAYAFGSMEGGAGDFATALQSSEPVLAGGLGQATMALGGDVNNVVGARQTGKQGMASGDEVELSKNIWFSVFGGTADQSTRDEVSGYEMDASGFTLGADTERETGWTLGVAGSFIQSDLDSDIDMGAQNVETDMVVLTAYASREVTRTGNLNLQASYGMGSNDTSREVFTGDVATADYDSTVSAASVQYISTRESDGKTTLAPYIGLDWTEVDVDGYRETGAGAFNLDLESDTVDALVLGVGVLANREMSDTLTLIGEVGVGYDFAASASTVSTALAGGGGRFTVEGVTPDQTLYNFGVGAEYATDGGTTWTLKYDVSGREDYSDDYFTLKANWQF